MSYMFWFVVFGWWALVGTALYLLMNMFDDIIFVKREEDE